LGHLAAEGDEGESRSDAFTVAHAGNRNGFQPGNFPSPLTPVPSSGRGRKQLRGRLFSAGLELFALEAGEGWKTDRDRVRT
jgi:hypothetical protein